VVLVVDVENLCQSSILAAIKEFSLYATVRVVKLVVFILPEFLTSFAAFSADLASIDYFRSRSSGDTRRKSCRTDVANTAADLSETPVRWQSLTREGREIVIF